MTSVRTISLAQALELLDAGAFVLDVREAHEWVRGHYDGAHHVALAEVPESLEQLPRERTIICVCRSGGRSRVATQYLSDHGFDVVNLEGGMLGWLESGEPLVADEGTPTII